MAGEWIGWRERRVTIRGKDLSGLLSQARCGVRAVATPCKYDPIDLQRLILIKGLS
jgi:hypothetical protein